MHYASNRTGRGGLKSSPEDPMIDPLFSELNRGVGMRSASRGFRVSCLAWCVATVATVANAATIINTGITVGGSFSAVSSVNFGDSRGAIPIGSMIATSAIPTTAGGPGIVPELGSGTSASRRVWAPSTTTQAQALSITGDANLGTLYQFLPPSTSESRTLNLYFATPILTGSFADVWLGVFPGGSGTTGFRNIVTFSGIDMDGNLVDSVLPTVNAQLNSGFGGSAPGNFAIDVNGAGSYTAGPLSITTYSYGINFNAGQTLKGIQLSWSGTTGGQRISEVWGVSAVPEPGPLALMAGGALGLLVYTRRQRRREESRRSRFVGFFPNHSVD